MDGIPHFLISLALSIVLYPLCGWLSFLIMIGGFAVDLDHYIFYLAIMKDLNPFNAYRYFKSGHRIIPTYCCFHTVEFVLIMLIFSFMHISLLLVTFGLIVHLLADLAYDVVIAGKELERFSIIAYAVAPSKPFFRI